MTRTEFVEAVSAFLKRHTTLRIWPDQISYARRHSAT
jgi:hypothetical protein